MKRRPRAIALFGILRENSAVTFRTIVPAGCGWQNVGPPLVGAPSGGQNPARRKCAAGVAEHRLLCSRVGAPRQPDHPASIVASFPRMARMGADKGNGFASLQSVVGPQKMPNTRKMPGQVGRKEAQRRPNASALAAIAPIGARRPESELVNFCALLWQNFRSRHGAFSLCLLCGFVIHRPCPKILLRELRLGLYGLCDKNGFRNLPSINSTSLPARVLLPLIERRNRAADLGMAHTRISLRKIGRTLSGRCLRDPAVKRR